MRHHCSSILIALVLACGGTQTSSGDGSGSGDAGTSGDEPGTSGGGGTTGTPDNVPDAATEEAIRAFLSGRGYEGDGWDAETTAPREASSQLSPHGRVRVYLNDQVQASQAAGNDGLDVPHDAWSMAVKEFYDDGDTLVGTATMFNALEGGDAPVWTYYCWGPADRCNTGDPEYPEDDPLIGQGLDVACESCHGGQIFTQIP